MRQELAWNFAVIAFISAGAFAGEPINDCGYIIQTAEGCVVFESEFSQLYAAIDFKGFGVGDAVQIQGTVSPGTCGLECPGVTQCLTVESIVPCNPPGVYVDACGTLLDQSGEIPPVICLRFQTEDGSLYLLSDAGDFKVGDMAHVTGFAHGPCFTLVCGAYAGCFSYNTIEPCAGDPPGDLDGDGDVDFADLLQLLSAWGPCTSIPECFEDLDGSGEVGFGDLLILLANWS